MIKKLFLLSTLLSLILLSAQTTDYSVTTFAGNYKYIYNEGIGQIAGFNKPRGIAVSKTGNIYVAEYGNHRIRKISPDGNVITLAGDMDPGFADGVGKQAKFYQPSAVAVDNNENVYVADSFNHKIRKISPTGVVTTIAGSTYGWSDGNAATAQFAYPNSIKIDPINGELWVGDYGTKYIRKISNSGVVSTVMLSGSPQKFAGLSDIAFNSLGEIYIAGNQINKMDRNGTITFLAGSGYVGDKDGKGLEADIMPVNLVVDNQNTVYFTDANFGNGNIAKIKKILPDGTVSTISGGTRGYKNGSLSIALYDSPHGLTISADGSLLISETGNNTIRKISFSSGVSTIAGKQNWYYQDGAGSIAKFKTPEGIAIDKNNNIVYVMDSGNNRVRKITSDGNVTTFAGSGAVGNNDATSTAATFGSLVGGAVDSKGNLYVADQINKSIRKITPIGVVTTFASGFGGPTAIAVDKNDNLFVADTYAWKVKKITPAGVVTDFAGSGNYGDRDGIGNAASFGYLSGITIDVQGYIYVSDGVFKKIKRISPDANVITYHNLLNTPSNLAIDSKGNLFLSDAPNRIIKIAPNKFTEYFGSGKIGFNDGNKTSASFNIPISFAIDAADNVFVLEYGNNDVRKITQKTLGANDNKLSLFKLFPNPTSDRLHFSEILKEISIINAEGRKVFDFKEAKELDVSSLLKGVYILKAKTKSGETVVDKFIKK